MVPSQYRSAEKKCYKDKNVNWKANDVDCLLVLATDQLEAKLKLTGNPVYLADNTEETEFPRRGRDPYLPGVKFVINTSLCLASKKIFINAKKDSFLSIHRVCLI